MIYDWTDVTDDLVHEGVFNKSSRRVGVWCGYFQYRVEMIAEPYDEMRVTCLACMAGSVARPYSMVYEKTSEFSRKIAWRKR